MINRSTSLSDVCFAICTALDNVGIVAVLCGGSAATVYAPHAYQSRDADFVITFASDLSAGKRAMKELGYTEAGGMYVHNFSPFTVEFPVGPLGIGDDLINSWSTFARDSELLHIVSATDCVRDRLAHFYYWNDYSALDAAVAVAVAQNNEIDLDAIRAWTLREGAVHVKKLTAFEERFSKAIRAG